MHFADAPAGEDDLVAGLVTVAVARLDRAGEIDAGNMRVMTDQIAKPFDDHAILVIDGGILDRDGDVAFGKVVYG